MGTRFLPITKSVPKELLPILDKPMLQYVVEEAAEAGIEQVIIVAAPGKESIASYFQPQPALEQHLSETGGKPSCWRRCAALPTSPGSLASFRISHWAWGTPS